MLTLAENDWVNWLTEDPTGRIVALCVLTAVALVVLYFVLRSVRWLAARWKPLFGAAVAIALVYVGAMWMLELGPMAWIVAGVIGLGGLFGIALFLTHS
jgi:hypothetical protein